MPTYYVISSENIGPNESSRINSHTYYISTSPATYNMSNEPCLNGWCGTTCDNAVYAHGVYDTLDAAREYILTALRDNWREITPSECNTHEGIIEIYGVGKYEQLNADESMTWCHAATENITPDTTDAEIAEIVADCEQLANAEEMSLDTDAITKMLTNTRNDLIAQLLDD